MSITTIEKIKEILQENKNMIESREKKITNYDIELMENKFEYDKVLLETIILSFIENEEKLTEDKKTKLEELANELFTIVNSIYESFDLQPIVKGFSTFGDDIKMLTESEIFENSKKIIKEEIELLVESCKRNNKNKKSKMKSKAKKKLIESKDLEKSIEYAHTYVFLEDLIDRIMFPGINYFEVFKNNYQLNEDEVISMDKEAIKDLIEKYVEVRDRFIDEILD